MAKRKKRTRKACLVDQMPRGRSLLDQKNPITTAIVRILHTCNNCQGSFTAKSQEIACRSCGSNNLNTSYESKRGARD